MPISSAITQDARSRVVGYKLTAGNFGGSTSNLPQKILILGEGNTANQATMTEDHFPFTSAKEVGDEFGYGSPLHAMARILRPVTGNVLGGIETVIKAKLTDAGGETATIITSGVAVATTVTKNVTHKVVINGRNSVDGASYAYNLTVGMNQATVAALIIDTVNNVIGAPVIAAAATLDIAFTSKWKGLSSAGLNISFDIQGEAAGVVYSEVSDVDGTGEITAVDSGTFDNVWYTLVLNSYGTGDILANLESINGIPDPTTPTGRYLADVFKPFTALVGSNASTKAALIAITDATARKTEVTNVLCPAPLSTGWDFEAAANMAVTYALIAQDTPHLGNGGRTYSDMPVPSDGDIGDMVDYVNRDYLTKRGCSTVTLNGGKYQVEDFQTMYHPDGDANPKYRKVRDLTVHFNIEFGWRVIMEEQIQDKTIIGSDQPVRVQNTISPASGKQLLFSYLDTISNLAFIVDKAFSEDSAQVGVNGSNPARLDFSFRYKVTSTADIVSTDAEFDFAYSVN